MQTMTESVRGRRACPGAELGLALVPAAALAGSGCKDKDAMIGDEAAHATPETARVVKLAFAYGSEKKAWLEDAIARFNADQKQRGGDPLEQAKAGATS